VVWREGEAEHAGLLTLSPRSIRLTGFGISAPPIHGVALDQIVGAELRRTETDLHRVSLVLTLNDGRRVEIESGVDRWIESSLLENVFASLLGKTVARRQVVLAVKLKPGRLDAARDLLRRGPPFDPALTSLVSHSVSLLDDEALFVFETHGDDEFEKLFDFGAWAAAARWRDVSTGEVRAAERAYSWNRGGEVPDGSSQTRLDS
jgi:hypothetical protein